MVHKVCYCLCTWLRGSESSNPDRSLQYLPICPGSYWICHGSEGKRSLWVRLDICFAGGLSYVWEPIAITSSGESLGDEQASWSRLLMKIGRPEFGVRLKFKNRAGNKADPRFRKFQELSSLLVYSPTRGETIQYTPGKKTSEERETPPLASENKLHHLKQGRR